MALNVSLLRAFELDDVAYIDGLAPRNVLNISIPASTFTTVQFAEAFCHGYYPPTMRYSSLMYDPTLTIVFDGSSSSPGASASPSAHVKPAVYAVPVALILGGVITFVLVAWFVPSVKAKVFPSSMSFNQLQASKAGKNGGAV